MSIEPTLDDHTKARDAAGREFQDLFAAFFPYFREDFEQAKFEMDWLANRFFGNPWETIRHTQALKAIDEVRVHLNRLATEAGHIGALVSLEHVIAGPAEAEIIAQEKRLLDLLDKLGATHDEGQFARVVDSLCARIETGIRRMPDTGNTNWQAVHAVESLRTLWKRNTGRVAPSRGLNTATSFAVYLRAGFDYLGVDADPRSAFRRWVAIRKVT